MSPAQYLRDALACGRAGCPCQKGPNTHCPVTSRHSHGDSDPSLTVNDGHNGDPVFHCKRGCDQQTILRELLDRQLWPVPGSASAERAGVDEPVTSTGDQWRFVAEWVYTNAEGEPVAVKRRYEHRTEQKDGKPKKRFSWLVAGCPLGDGCKGLSSCTVGQHGLSPTDLPLYNHQRLAEAPELPVIFCEGEKAADAATATGEAIGVCVAGSASTRKFGNALDPLVTRDTVILFPDNDSAGRDFMRVVQGLLPHAHVVMPAGVPAAGDIVEYLAGGGTIPKLLELAIQTPKVEAYGDQVAVDYPTDGGWIRFECSEFHAKSQELKARLIITPRVPGLPRSQFTGRIDLMSSTARGNLRRELEVLFKSDETKPNWALVLGDVFALVEKAWRESVTTQRLAEVAPDFGCEWAVDDFLPLLQATILYATGGSGKTWIELYLALCIVLGRPFFGRRVRPSPVLMIDWESTAPAIARRVHRLCRGLGVEVPFDFHYLAAEGRPLIRLVEDGTLRRMLNRYGIDVIMLDSAVLALGGDPNDAAAVGDFFRALAKLDVTTLIVSHVTKNGEGKDDNPFGSIYFRNNARAMWLVKPSEEETLGEDLQLALVNKKINDGGRLAPIGVRVQFGEGPQAPITLQYQSLHEAPADLRVEVPLPKRILAELYNASRPLPVGSLVDAIGAGLDDQAKLKLRNQIQSRLSELRTKGRVRHHEGGYWSPAA